MDHVMNYGGLPCRFPVREMPGVEITELADGAFYFAPPGDFSKVDFSVCQKQEPEPYGVTLEFHGPKGGEGYWSATLQHPCMTIGYHSRDPGFALDLLGLGHLKRASYGPVNKWSLDEAAGVVSGLHVSGIAYSATETAQHAQQAKRALPSLQTVAGDKYRGTGWCDAA